MKLITDDAVIKAVDKHTFETDDGLCLDDDITCIVEEIDFVQPHRKISTILNIKPWTRTDEEMPPIGQWVLVTQDDDQKPIEIMCYQGVRIGEKFNNKKREWEKYKYPSWTSGHGDIQGWNPIAWMSLPRPYQKGD